VKPTLPTPEEAKLRALLTKKVAEATKALAKARGKKIVDIKTYRDTYFKKFMPLYNEEKKKQNKK
jgi:hypothetical protein